MSTGGNLGLRLFLRLAATAKSTSGDLVEMPHDVARIEALAEAFLSAPALAAATRAQVDGGRVTSVTPKTRARLPATGRKSEVEYVDRAKPDRSVLVLLSFDEAEIEVRVVVEGEQMAKHRSTALGDLIAAVQRATDAWRGVAGVSDGWIKAEYADNEPPYARPRPPRESMRFPRRSIVTFLDPSFHASDHARARPRELEALVEPPAPAPAVVTTRNGLITVRWAQTLDDDAIATASTSHELWLGDRIAVAVQDGFNADGDEAVAPGNAKPQPPLTLYNPYAKIGFKAVLVLPDGVPEASAWDEANAIVQAQALPDGTPVEALWLVVPLREHAIALHTRAVEAGFRATLYPDNHGRFWDPCPPGQWLPQGAGMSEKVRT